MFSNFLFSDTRTSLKRMVIPLKINKILNEFEGHKIFQFNKNLHSKYLSQLKKIHKAEFD